MFHRIIIMIDRKFYRIIIMIDRKFTKEGIKLRILGSLLFFATKFFVKTFQRFVQSCLWCDFYHQSINSTGKKWKASKVVKEKWKCHLRRVRCLNWGQNSRYGSQHLCSWGVCLLGCSKKHLFQQQQNSYSPPHIHTWYLSFLLQ